MAAELNKNHDEPARPRQQSSCGAGKGGCCQCQQVIEHMSCGYRPSESADIREVLLVFGLPLICAAGVVIWAVRSWPTMAEHPWYLVLAALGTACGAIGLAKVLTSRRAKDGQTQE